MSARQRHSGPDGTGVWNGGRVGLAHARLAIIDLSPAADQPMADEDGVIHPVHHGEIYNFQALRDELIALGHRFSSQGYAEVLVARHHPCGQPHPAHPQPQQNRKRAGHPRDARRQDNLPPAVWCQTQSHATISTCNSPRKQMVKSPRRVDAIIPPATSVVAKAGQQ